MNPVTIVTAVNHDPNSTHPNAHFMCYRCGKLPVCDHP